MIFPEDFNQYYLHIYCWCGSRYTFIADHASQYEIFQHLLEKSAYLFELHIQVIDEVTFNLLAEHYRETEILIGE